MATLTHVVELELSASVWTDVSADVLGDIVADYGMAGGGPLDRCAQTGRLQLALRNDAGNSGGKQGYYSPGHANCRAGFDVGIGIRWRATSPSARSFFRGWIVAATPAPGDRRDQLTWVMAVDWMDEAAAVNVKGLTTQTGKRADQILTTLLTSLSKQPVATDFSTGDSTFAYALDNVQDESTHLLSTINDLVCSEGSYIYCKGDGTLVFESRTDRVGARTPIASLMNEMLSLAGGRTRDDIVNVALLTVHPRRIDAAATTVLWSRNIANGDAPVEIGPGDTAPTLLGAYGDPNNGRQRCGGTDMVTPVATTDYQMFANADGTGTDLTASLSVTASLGGNGVSWVLTNNAAVTGYVTKLQCRGRGIYDKAATVVRVEDTASVTTYGERPIRIDMPYQDDETAAAAFGNLVLNMYSRSGSIPQRIGFLANVSDQRMTDALAVDVGSQIELSEGVSAMAAMCCVAGCRYRFERGALRVEWLLSPADTAEYWVLGTSDDLGVNTILGYG